MQNLSEESINLNALEVVDMISTNRKLFLSTLADQNDYKQISTKLIKENSTLYLEQNEPQEANQQELKHNYQVLISNLDSQYYFDNSKKEYYASFYTKVEKEVNKLRGSFLKNQQKDLEKSEFKLLYRASRDGFFPKYFHTKCDNKGPTITFYLSSLGKTFGIVAFKSWDSPDKATFQQDPDMFLFQLDYKTIHKQINNNESLQYLSRSYFPSAGITLEFDMRSNQGLITGQTTSFGKHFDVSKLKSQGMNDCSTYLGGAAEFELLEIEVYSFKSQ
ncbi:TLDc domain-containing protein [Oxytricha trifallax]|uniref:TLDc domain-containing protein n=1 Tax=Oxytricha trifallax TaxID=1172189 RepID=A0A073IBJ2_9SPIT|nr:TLDc domain-containing protein [Oxytricha trifallax]